MSTSTSAKRVKNAPAPAPAPELIEAAVGENGNYAAILKLVGQFRQEVLGRMDELEERFDTKFTALPDQYPTRREFTILQGQVERLEARYNTSAEGQWRNLMSLSQRTDNAQIGMLQQEVSSATTKHEATQARWTSWQIALLAGGLTILGMFIQVLFSLIPHLHYGP